jgi:alkylation response protein AidB-like acyl-CoA dehydrogenase
MTQEQQALQASLRDWAKRAGTIAAIRKLLGTAHRQEAAESALEHLGPAGAAETEASQEFLLTRCLSIAGGTTQILLTQVAERVLGLPR